MPTALIVEDEPEANKLLAMLVQLRGYRTVSTLEGRAAVAAARRERPDVVFLDLMLPDVSGYRVCRALKGRKSTAAIPVVIVTARVAVEHRIQSYRRQADRYVPKPYTPDQIFDALDEAEAWAREASGAVAAEVPLTSGDDGETLRRFAHLVNTLFALTPLRRGGAVALGEGLARLYDLVESWSQRTGCRQAGVLDVQAFPDRVEMTLRDPAGTGFLAPEAGPPGRWDDVIETGGFETPAGEDSAEDLRLVKRFAPA